jgi:Na+-transporting NADH:ubiquinone oxidoreductase subunit F
MSTVILSLLIVSAMAAFLALLLEIADMYIADYGECHILVNEEKDLVVRGGSPLFFSLMEHGIFIPSACGGKGTCSYCKVKVLEGGGPILPTETPYLSAEEQEAGVRLSCQVKVRNDVKIEIPEELFNIKEYKVRVHDRGMLTEVIKDVRLEILDPPEGIKFKPGQYIQLQVPAYELSKTTDFRAFSIASPADEHDHVDLMITRAPEGLVALYVHDYMKDGEELVMRGPFGDFYYREGDREMILIATGSGLAPIRSILHHMERNNVQRKATLFFGGRTEADLIHREQLEELENKLYDFKYVPILSNIPDDDPWPGERGYIPPAVEKYIGDIPSVDAYLCGAPIVVEICDKALVEKGLTKDHIFYDKFA